MLNRTPVGHLLREWRQRRRLSQLALAYDAEISARHLSFIETGRAQPSRDMVLHLSEQLEVPVRERNVLLVAAGYAPIFPERPLEDPAMSAARAAIDLVLERQKPYPAFALDRRWHIVASNAALPELYDGVDPDLLQPPVNVMRLSLHPKGLAPRIANLAEWRAHLLFRLRRQAETHGRRGSDRAVARGKRLSGARWQTAAGVRSRHRRAVSHPYVGRASLLLQHDHGIRHAGRRDALRIGARIVLPRRL
jgi:transcriptional regulator with XRE-family HTH domain